MKKFACFSGWLSNTFDPTTFSITQAEWDTKLKGHIWVLINTHLTLLNPYRRISTLGVEGEPLFLNSFSLVAHLFELFLKHFAFQLFTSTLLTHKIFHSNLLIFYFFIKIKSDRGLGRKMHWHYQNLSLLNKLISKLSPT